MITWQATGIGDICIRSVGSNVQRHILDYHFYKRALILPADDPGYLPPGHLLLALPL